MDTIEVESMRIAYRSAGDARKPGLLLLHGWPLTSAIYGTVLDELARDFHVMAPDLPDVGNSSGAPPSAEKHVLADIMLTFAERLRSRPIIVAGFDVGGMIAYAAARDHSDRIVGAVVANTVIPGLDPWSKVIADPRIWHFAFHSIPELPETLVAGHQRRYFDFFFDFLAGSPEVLTDDLRNEMARGYERPQALKAGFDWYRAFEKDARRNREPKRIELPLLYLRGGRDEGRDVHEYAAGLEAGGAQHLSCDIIENSGEYLPLEAPQAFCERLRKFGAAALGGKQAI